MRTVARLTGETPDDDNRSVLTLNVGAVGPVEIRVKFGDDLWRQATPELSRAMCERVAELSERLAKTAFRFFDEVEGRA